MDVTPILDPLNDPQREAVTAPPAEPVLVLAGAGSGKTRVLVHRIAWLVQVEDVSPLSVMAVTFTNKAAGEMRARIEQLIGSSAGAMWVGTFHGLAHRLLRQHWREAELPQAFQILDAEDQQRLLRRVLKNLEIDEARWPVRPFQWFINGQKDEGLRPRHLRDNGDPSRRQMIRVYTAYEEARERGGLVDFPELLLRAHELFLNHPDLLAHYQRRFRHVLVDEFQDTNAIQYAWVRVLAGDSGYPFIVGDDDQSIYGWRGARIENLHRFRDDFRNTRTVRLEQNYRSTETILSAANALIAHNSDRMGKTLWTEGNEGEPIQLYAAYNEGDEAQFVIDRIREWIENGGARSEAAILYRSNAQSRVFEEALINAGIPYRVYGGLRFFERQEIKDALAYMKLIANRHDDASFERVVNHPTRGIGNRTMDAVREVARLRSLSLWDAAGAVMQEGKLASRATSALAKFLDLINELDAGTADMELHELAEHVIHNSGLDAHYRKERGERAEARLENLEELVSAARGFETDPDLDMSRLVAFLTHAALEAGEGQADAWEDCVQMMTMHSAKGLEFPVVFVAGLEDGLFPHQRASMDPRGLEEERRLCYVGMTRAMERLYLTYAERRRLYGRDTYGAPSRFLREIPERFLNELRPRVQVSRPVTTGTTSLQEEMPEGLSLGARVRHPKFGEGLVMNCEGSGPNARVQVNFEDAGSKWLVLGFANLDVL